MPEATYFSRDDKLILQMAFDRLRRRGEELPLNENHLLTIAKSLVSTFRPSTPHEIINETATTLVTSKGDGQLPNG